MKVGDMVKWHDSEAKKFRNGIIIEVKPLDMPSPDARFIYHVLWGNGIVYPHKFWELRKIDESW